jgi:hypothetical protein
MKDKERIRKTAEQFMIALLTNPTVTKINSGDVHELIDTGDEQALIETAIYLAAEFHHTIDVSSDDELAKMGRGEK